MNDRGTGVAPVPFFFLLRRMRDGFLQKGLNEPGHYGIIIKYCLSAVGAPWRRAHG